MTVRIFCLCYFYLFLLHIVTVSEVPVIYTFKNAITDVNPITHFWKSTGFCPFGSRGNVSDYILSEDVRLNLVLIGAMPNDAIKYVRVHWLLDLLKIIEIDQKENLYLNYTDLDSFMDLLHSQDLMPVFEIMGNPVISRNGKTFFNDLTDLVQKKNWYEMILGILSRYVERYGLKYVSLWKFETWNEPDLKMYNIIPFSYEGYLNYVRSSKRALNEIKRRTNSINGFILGGPAGLFKNTKYHRLCWGFLKECINAVKCPVSFLTYHAKGDETTKGVIEKGLNIITSIKSNFSYVGNLPIANTESDVLTGWSKSRKWRGDVRYAAMMIKILFDHINEMQIKRNISIELLSNDNAFLNYHPFYFEQRTLLARFQMNNTNPKHIQFIKKPIYVATTLLSLMCNSLYGKSIKVGDLELLETVTYRSEFNEFTLIGVAVNDTFEDTTKRIFHYEGHIGTCHDKCKFVIYLMDNYKTNPFDVWKSGGRPVFPDKDLRRKMREMEGPFRYIPPSDGRLLNISLEYTIPTVFVLHACEKRIKPPGPVVDLRNYNVTQNEVILVWSDRRVNTRCIKTYEIEHMTERSSRCNSTNKLFQRVNADDVIFLWYQHVPADDKTTGAYRVRAVDYWDRPGLYSSVIYVK